MQAASAAPARIEGVMHYETKLSKTLSATAEGAWLEGEHDRELKADVKLNWAF